MLLKDPLTYTWMVEFLFKRSINFETLDVLIIGITLLGGRILVNEKHSSSLH